MNEGRLEFWEEEEEEEEESQTESKGWRRKLRDTLEIENGERREVRFSSEGETNIYICCVQRLTLIIYNTRLRGVEYCSYCSLPPYVSAVWHSTLFSENWVQKYSLSMKPSFIKSDRSDVNRIPIVFYSEVRVNSSIYSVGRISIRPVQ